MSPVGGSSLGLRRTPQTLSLWCHLLEDSRSGQGASYWSQTRTVGPTTAMREVLASATGASGSFFLLLAIAGECCFPKSVSGVGTCTREVSADSAPLAGVGLYVAAHVPGTDC